MEIGREYYLHYAGEIRKDYYVIAHNQEKGMEKWSVLGSKT
jgi:hypothetical protein